MKSALLMFILLLLSACETPGSYGPDSPYYHYPAGSRLILNRELEIPGGWATARLQFGRVVPFGHVQEYQPHCIFEINTVRPEPQHVQPDTFEIIRVQRTISEFANIAAAPGYFLRTGFGDGFEPVQMFYKTTFILHSARQPGVMRMVCQSDQYAGGNSIPRYLTLSEIRQALGDIFTLELPGTGL
jgi:hypothetical protein